MKGAEVLLLVLVPFLLIFFIPFDTPSDPISLLFSSIEVSLLS